MNIVLFDDAAIRQDLMPFTLTRPVAAIRIGILTIRDKWAVHSGSDCSYLTESYLQAKYSSLSSGEGRGEAPGTSGKDNLFINGALCPDPELVNAVKTLGVGESLMHESRLLAVRGSTAEATSSKKNYPGAPVWIDQVWKIFQHNGAQVKADFALITRGRKSQPITDPHTRVYKPEDIFIEEGVELNACVLNASTGPIYLGKNSQVQEGAVIRGPFSLGESSVVNMGAKIRGDTSVGPQCKVGGEITNSVIFGYSNKGHDGFLGSSVLGEWCNLGADTNVSNLKNNYEDVKLWSYRKGGFSKTGMMFCGLMMGDHSKCGINTMFNTGTVVGVGANIFGDGYPRNFIPSFAWGGAAGFSTFKLDKVFETASKVMERRNTELTEPDRKILTEVFRQTAGERIWEKK